MDETNNIIDVLDILAFGLLGQSRFEQSLSLYRFLHHLQPDEAKWRLGIGFCLLNQRKIVDIPALMQNFPPGRFTKSRARLEKRQALLKENSPLKPV